MTIQSDLPKLLGSLCMEAVPRAVVKTSPRHTDLHMTCSHVHMQVQMTFKQFQAKKMTILK